MPGVAGFGKNAGFSPAFPLILGLVPPMKPISLLFLVFAVLAPGLCGSASAATLKKSEIKKFKGTYAGEISGIAGNVSLPNNSTRFVAEITVTGKRREALPVDFWVKRLCGRIDLQMRRLMEGSRQLADRLHRDVLYYLAQDRQAVGRALEARETFRLGHYLPAEISEEALRAEAGWRPHLNALREALNTAKDHWMKICS